MAQQNTVGRVVTAPDTRTPGPWYVWEGVGYLGIGPVREKPIVEIVEVGANFYTTGENRANARAIAELPALEEAARAVVGPDTRDGLAGRPASNAEIAALRAVLARMDGGDDA